MAQTAAAPIPLLFLLLQMIMPLPPDTHKGPVVYVLCLSLSLESYLFSSVVPVTGDDILGDLFFSIFVLRLCCLSGFSCAFYLTNIYCKVVCCSLTLFFYQRVYRPKSLALSVTYYAFSPRSFFFLRFLFFFALMLILDGLFHSLSITLFSHVLPVHSFDHLFVDVFSDSCRLSVTMAYLLSPSSTFAHLTTISYFFFCLGVTNKS